MTTAGLVERMSEERRTGAALLAIFGGALLVRIVILTQTPALGAYIVDEQHYIDLATNLYQGNGFAWSQAGPTSIRPPLFPFLVSVLWHAVGGENLQAVRMLNIAFALATVGLVFAIGRRLFDERAGLLAAAIYAFYPTLVGFNFLILTETLFNLLVVLGAYAYVRLASDLSWRWAVLLGLGLGLAALTRSIAWPFFLILGIAMLALVPAPPARRVAIVVVAFVGFAAVVGPWSARNTRLQGTSVLVDTMGGLNLYMGNYEHTPLTRAWDAISIRGEKAWVYQLHAEKPPGETWSEGRKEQWAKAKAKAFMLENPGLTLLRSTIKFANFWGLERVFPAGWQRGWYRPPKVLQALGTIAVVGGWIVVSVGGVIGLFLARGRAPRLEAYWWLMAFVMAGVHSLVFGHSRYHLPLIPFLAIYLAAAIDQQAWRRLRGGGVLAVSAGACVAGLLAVWVFEVLFVEGDRIRALLERVL